MYRKIAKKYGVTPTEVKRDMQSALEEAYKNSNSNDFIKMNQEKVPRKGEVPTPDEFIRYAVERIKNKT